MCLSTCKQTSLYAFHNFPRTPFHAHAGYGEYPHTHTPHPKLAIILNPSPAWVIPDNPGLILVNSGHSSAGFHPETTETGWGLVGSWRVRLGAALTDIIGQAVIGSQEKQAQVFPRGLQKYIRIDPPLRHAAATVLLPLQLENMFFTVVYWYVQLWQKLSCFVCSPWLWALAVFVFPALLKENRK